MIGVITTRDVISNLGLIWREFGFATVVRCLKALATGRTTTFLEIACASRAVRQ